MTASDNVLRLGLTRKDVAVNAALEAMVDRRPTLVRGRSVDGSFDYLVDGAPFIVTRLTGSGVETRLSPGVAATALCVEGSAVVTCADRTETLSAGRAALVAADDHGAVVRADGLTVVARVS
jgi:mannose-6-phosphate isomerase class I